MTSSVKEAFADICESLESGIRSGHMKPDAALLLGENDSQHVTLALDPDAPDGAIGAPLREFILSHELSWAVLLRPFVRLSRNGTTTSVGVLAADEDGTPLCVVYDIDPSADSLYRICPSRKGAERELLHWAEGFLPPQPETAS